MEENELKYGGTYFLMINGKKAYKGIYIGNRPERNGLRHFMLIRESGSPISCSFLIGSSAHDLMVDQDTIRLPINFKKSYVGERERDLAKKILETRGL